VRESGAWSSIILQRASSPGVEFPSRLPADILIRDGVQLVSKPLQFRTVCLMSLRLKIIARSCDSKAKGATELLFSRFK